MVRNYYVDEAGDGNLFGRRGKVLVGKEGCSRYFILGVLDVDDPTALARDLTQLRTELLADPYFAGVPSMQPERRKTALFFHAKDDLPEVRREVFQLLARHELRFLACVKDKLNVLEYVRVQRDRDPSYRYRSNELYDYLVRRLFREMLHTDDEYNIHFARRWRTDRTEALRLALLTARSRSEQDHGIATSPRMNVVPSSPPECVCLQAADYYLWALQRLYERREERFVRLMWPGFGLVIDMDDQREAGYRAYYTQKKPLTLAALKGEPGI